MPGVSLAVTRAAVLARAAGSAALEYISPTRCVSCGVAGRWLCRTCGFSLVDSPRLGCPGCGLASDHGIACEDCRALGSPLDQLVSAVSYERPVLHKLLWSLKESGNREVLPYLSRRLATAALQHVTDTASPDGTVTSAAVIPIPATRARTRTRGFNQAAVLAAPVAHVLGMLMRTDILTRTKDARSQKTLDVHGRRAALKGAYALTRASETETPIEHVVLVDDITTTLATLETCAALLKTAGVKRVTGIVLAHAQGHADREVAQR